MSSEPSSAVDLRAVLAVIRRHAWIVIACAVLTAIAAYAFSATQQKEYSASASLLFRNPGFDQTLFGSQSFQPETDASREAATNVDLASLAVVSQHTAMNLGLPAGEVSSDISVSPKGDSDVVAVAATTPSPALSARMANTYAEQFIAFRRHADRAKVATAQRLVERRLARMTPSQRTGQEGKALQHQLSSLETLGALQTGNAEVVQHADVPSAASSPRIVRNTILGVLVGLFLGLGLAFLRERIDRRIREPGDLEDALSLPLLGGIPNSRALAYSGRRPRQLPFAEAEAFRLVRTRLRYFNVDREIRSVLVTSGAPKDGKSTVAFNLALAAVSFGANALLLESDFHHPSVASRQGLDPVPGLSEVLSRQAGVRAAIQAIPAENRTNGGPSERWLHTIVAGATPPNPGALLESHEMAGLLDALGKRYDLIVIDSPPVSLLADAIPLMKLVDGVIVVGALGKTTREEAVHLRQQLASLDAPVMGVVANRVRVGRRYGYGYYSPRGGRNGRRSETSSRERIGRTG